MQLLVQLLLQLLVLHHQNQLQSARTKTRRCEASMVTRSAMGNVPLARIQSRRTGRSEKAAVLARLGPQQRAAHAEEARKTEERVVRLPQFTL